ncbi:hypothetical protein QTO02_29575, partial [Vibrio fortis]
SKGLVNKALVMKIALIFAVLLQIGQAVTSHGLTRSLAEFTAFILVVVLVMMKKQENQANTSVQEQ